MGLVESFRVIELCAGSSWEPRSEHPAFTTVQPWKCLRFRKSFSLGELPSDRSFNSASIGNRLRSVASPWKKLRSKMWPILKPRNPKNIKIMVFWFYSLFRCFCFSFNCALLFLFVVFCLSFVVLVFCCFFNSSLFFCCILTCFCWYFVAFVFSFLVFSVDLMCVSVVFVFPSCWCMCLCFCVVSLYVYIFVFICVCETKRALRVSPGGNQVDGLPPASSNSGARWS